MLSDLLLPPASTIGDLVCIAGTLEEVDMDWIGLIICKTNAGGHGCLHSVAGVPGLQVRGGGGRKVQELKS